MGTYSTTIHGLIVPDGNDPIDNGDDLLRALADRLDKLVNTVGDIKMGYQTADHGNKWYIMDGRGLAGGNGGTGAAILKAGLPAAFVTLMVAAGYEVDATHIAIPDWRGRGPVMKGTAGEIDAFTDNDGEVVGNRRPKHRHTVNDPWHSHPAHGKVSDTMDPPDGSTAKTGFAGGGFNAQSIFVDTAPTNISVGPQISSPTDGAAFAVVNFFVFAGDQ